MPAARLCPNTLPSSALQSRAASRYALQLLRTAGWYFLLLSGWRSKFEVVNVFAAGYYQEGRAGLLGCDIGRKTLGGCGLGLQGGHVESGRRLGCVSCVVHVLVSTKV